MRSRNDPRRSQTLYKFIVYQTKGLVSNNRGKPSYSDSFDRVIYDLYNVKHFSRKIADYYDDRDIMDLIDRVGLEHLVRLMKNGRYCNIVRELTLIDNDTESLEKEIRKMRKKGRSNKHMLREFNDLKKLYDKGIKSLRRRLGLRNARAAYKTRYMAVRDLISNGNSYYDDDLSFSGLSNVRYRGEYDPYDNGRSYDYDDDPYYDDREYDEYYDEDSSELEDFERMLNGPNRGPRERRVTTPHDDDYYDNDPYDHRNDSDELREYEEYHRNRELRDVDGDRLGILTTHVSELSDQVQALMSQYRYDQVNHRDPLTHFPQRNYAKEYIPPQSRVDTEAYGSQEKFMATIIGEMNSLKDATNHLVEGMLNFQEWQNQINELLVEDALDDDVEMGEPVIDSGNNYYQQIANAHPDIYETPMEQLPEDEKVPPMPPKPKDPNHMTHQEVIAEVNRSQAQKANWSKDQKKEPQTTAREQKPVLDKNEQQSSNPEPEKGDKK